MISTIIKGNPRRQKGDQRQTKNIIETRRKSMELIETKTHSFKTEEHTMKTKKIDGTS